MTNRTIRAVLLDLSGTLHNESVALPGAVEAVARLQDKLNLVRVLTNTSTVSVSGLQQKLTSMGFAFEQEQMYTSVLAVQTYLSNNNLRPFCLLEDTSDFEKAGIPLTPPYDSVVLGLAPSKCSYGNLDKAYRILQEDDHKLVVMHRSPFVKTEQGRSLGPGAFAAALEAAVPGLEAIVLGKPSPEFFLNAIPNQIDPSHVCMVGDDVNGDVLGAQNAGIGTSILVQTGKYENGDEEKVAPTKVVRSIVEAVDYILENLSEE